MDTTTIWADDEDDELEDESAVLVLPRPLFELLPPLLPLPLDPDPLPDTC